MARMPHIDTPPSDLHATTSSGRAPKSKAPASRPSSAAADSIEGTAGARRPLPQSALVKPAVAAAKSTACLQPGAFRPAEPHKALEGLRHLLHAGVRDNADDGFISTVVDAAFAAEFAILATADTDVRSGKDELARSKKAVMCTIWMYRGDYQAFTRG